MFVIKNKYRIKFEKTDRMRFIGHLDLLKIMQRTVRRAGVPISYSQGFNPHQIMSFALPLSLSVQSVGEYLDVELAEEMDCAEIKERLNKAMPNGLKVVDVKHLEETDKTCASLVRVGAYEVELKTDIDKNEIVEKINALNNQDEVLVMKKTKRSFEETDIKSDIFNLSYDDENDKILMTISTGSQKNIKPDLVLKALFGDDVSYLITRLEMYYENTEDDGTTTFKPLI